MSVVILEGQPIGELRSLDLHNHRDAVPVNELKFEEEYFIPRRMTMTVKLEKMKLFGPLALAMLQHKRNPPVWALRVWYVEVLGNSNRKFKRVRLAVLRRMWRRRFYQPRIERIILEQSVKDLVEIEDDRFLELLAEAIESSN